MATTRTNYPYRVRLARRSGQPVGPAAYRSWQGADWLVPLEVRAALAPDYTTAKLLLDTTRTRSFVWNWNSLLSFDDRIEIYNQRHAPFLGFVADVEWSAGQRDQHGVITAVSSAFRLKRDAQYMVYGRYMKALGDEVYLYSGLPCEFNAGGRPNRATELSRDITDCPVNGVHGGLGLFTYDGDPTAAWWTAAEAMDYLMWRYNGAETWMSNATLPMALYDTHDYPVCGVDGQSLWEALATVADRAGLDVCETVERSAGQAYGEMKIARRGAGTVRSVRRQDWSGAGTPPAVDLTWTNLFTCRVAESTSQAVTAPILAGGRDIYEITVELQPAFGAVVPGATAYGYRGELTNDTDPYRQKWCTTGELFYLHRDEGRLWDANTDGRFSGSLDLHEGYELTVTDVAALCGLPSNCWPAMPYPPRPLLTQEVLQASAFLQPGHHSLGFHVQYSLDAGEHWNPLRSVQVLPDRLGVYITQTDLSQLTSYHSPGPELNFFSQLVDAPDQVKVRLTCCVEDPDRNICRPPAVTGAGSAFATSEWHDRASIGQARVRISDALAGPADERWPQGAIDELSALAQEIQAEHCGREVSADLPIEWPDEEIGLTDVIQQIGGIAYPLDNGTGGRSRFPRVVGIHYHLTGETYSMSIQLGTPRFAGVLASREARQQGGQAAQATASIAAQQAALDRMIYGATMAVGNREGS